MLSLKDGLLGLRAEEPLHGYEVKNRFEAMLGGTWEVNIGQVYTTLQRLERDGLVRPAGERGDRGKLLYELSDSGRKALDEWLAQPEAGPPEPREDIYLKLLLAARLANRHSRPLLRPQQPADL